MLVIGTPWVMGQENSQEGSSACVLLKNDNVIHGLAHQVGEFVVIRRGNESEVRLPRQAVACWAGSVRDLYRYRADHRETQGFDIHMQEADWCLQQDLLDLARLELAAAQAIRPQSAAARRLEQRLRRLESPVRRRVPVAKNILPVSHAETPVMTPGLDQAMIGAFAKSVQVTLINRCGNCHAEDSDRAWRIISPPGNTRASAETTHTNLRQTLPFIDPASPLQSPLLMKAVSPHGGGPAPLGPRHAKAVLSLKYWLRQAGRRLDQHPIGSTSTREPRIKEPGPEKKPEVAQENSWKSLKPSEEASEASSSTPSGDEASRRSASGGSDPDSSAQRMPRVANPFDPDLFNRQYHR